VADKENVSYSNKGRTSLFLLAFSLLGLFSIAALSFSASTYIYPGGINTGNLSSNFINASEISTGSVVSSILESVIGVFSKVNVTSVLYAYNATSNYLTTNFAEVNNISAKNVAAGGILTTSILADTGKINNLQSDVVNSTNIVGVNATVSSVYAENVSSNAVQSSTVQTTNVSAQNVNANSVFVSGTTVSQTLNATDVNVEDNIAVSGVVLSQTVNATNVNVAGELNSNNVSTPSVYSNEIYTQDLEASDNIKGDIINAKNISANNVTAVNVTATDVLNAGTIIAKKIEEGDLAFGTSKILLKQNTSVTSATAYYGAVCPYDFSSNPTVIVTPVSDGGDVILTISDVNTTCFTVHVTNETSNLLETATKVPYIIVNWFAKAS